MTAIVAPKTLWVSVAIRLMETATSPRKAARRQEMFEQVPKEVASMEPLVQKAMALRHLEEPTNAEAARVLCIGQKGNCIRFMLALGRLQNKLSQLPDFLEDQPHG